jgi:serine/threonine protein kinase
VTGKPPARDSDATPRFPVNAGQTAPAPPEAASLAHDGRYLLDREIAHGGMGRIYAGRDLRLSRPVAIKILRQPTPSALVRFEREILLAARLQHPGIVSVYDAGFLPTGEPFLVMKLVLGRSFDRVIADADSLADRLALLPHLVAVADALAYAHDQGIVHRDLKPSNIIVGAFGETVVLDWGLAKDLRASAPTAPTGDTALPPSDTVAAGQTQQGSVLGTPAYMAPEQAAGQPVDARADVYALGAIIYQTLSGLPPTPPEDENAIAPLDRWEPRLPDDLLAIVRKAMSAQESDRYPSAFELGDDLKRFLAGQRVQARVPSGWLRHKLALGSLAILGAVLAGIAIRHC